MGTMEVVNLDDTVDSSLFVIDEVPITEEVTNKDMGKKRKASLKKKNLKRAKQQARNDAGDKSANRKNHYVVMGGEIPDDGSLRLTKRKSLETIVIDDDESIIELSDDELGVIGGELSLSVERAQRQIDDYHMRCQQRLEPAKETRRQQRTEPPKETRSKQRFDPPKEKKSQVPVVKEQSPPGTTSLTKPVFTIADKEEIAKRKRRPVVIDGSNIAFGHGGSRRQFSSKGIEICVNYFIKRGHTVKVFVPQFRRRHVATLDTHILDKLEEDKIIVYTPSRHVNGKTVVSYDDRMMVEYAAQCGAVIVTRDNLRDLASESEVFKKVIDERVLMFTWVDDEVILFPQDPLGRTGPCLDEFLSFPPEDPPKEEEKDEKPSKENDST